MAMLAEKRQRKKWCLNPRGNLWAKDENKFGQRMLEKMGWEPGTGLGARGQGRTDIIKYNIKSDNRGLGCDKKFSSENWKAHIESFGNLLAELNESSKTNDNEVTNVASLEKKSKASRARVHYHKFTRGKDVSRYSSEDLKCILPLKNNKKNEDEPVSSKNNMYEYFKNKNKSYNSEEKTDHVDFNDLEHNNQYNNTYKDVKEVLSLTNGEDLPKKKKRKNKDYYRLQNEDSLNGVSRKKKHKTKTPEIVKAEDNDDSKISSNIENIIHNNEDQTYCPLSEDLETTYKKNKKKKKKKSK